jgi:hypothetical protein
MKKTFLPVIAAHLAGWILFQSLPLSFMLSQGRTHLTDVLITWQFWQFCFFYILVFYLHSYWLLPRLFYSGKKSWYLILTMLLLASCFLLEPFEKMIHANRNFPPIKEMREAGKAFPKPPMPGGNGPNRMNRPGVDIISIILFVMTIAVSVVIDLTRRWRETAERAAKAEADKVNAELSFLRAQVNPHFLFNTLNNIYSMAVTKNEHTADTIMKLSNIMRYVTDDVNEESVSLQSEVDCITDYIDLQKLRLGKKVLLEYSVTGDLENKKIAPLLLMSFIENVFKYGISNHQESVIVIRLSAEEEYINFFAQNKLFATERKTERTGIGIGNTKKRLAHLYPGKHGLLITRENGLFTVELSLYN